MVSSYAAYTDKINEKPTYANTAYIPQQSKCIKFTPQLNPKLLTHRYTNTGTSHNIASYCCCTLLRIVAFKANYITYRHCHRSFWVWVASWGIVVSFSVKEYTEREQERMSESADRHSQKNRFALWVRVCARTRCKILYFGFVLHRTHMSTVFGCMDEVEPRFCNYMYMKRVGNKKKNV